MDARVFLWVSDVVDEAWTSDVISDSVSDTNDFLIDSCLSSRGYGMVTTWELVGLNIFVALGWGRTSWSEVDLRSPFDSALRCRLRCLPLCERTLISMMSIKNWFYHWDWSWLTFVVEVSVNKEFIKINIFEDHSPFLWYLPGAFYNLHGKVSEISSAGTWAAISGVNEPVWDYFTDIDSRR